MTSVCPCGSEDIFVDTKKGDSVCRVCGRVIEENGVISDIAFEDTKVIGTFVNNNSLSSSFLKNRYRGSLQDSRQARINKANQIITQIAYQLSIDAINVENAKRLYSLVSTNFKFIQGRKTRHVAAVALYIICRWKKTPHMMLDFADILQTNVYVLASVYMKLINLLRLQIPLIDPSFFIHRFCIKLGFKENIREIEKTVQKIIKFFNHDWITTGRKPNGLCGAAIFIAARMNGLNKDIKEVAQVVHVCEQTLRKRINEFCSTQVSDCKVDKFKLIDCVELESEDPPSFKELKLDEIKLLRSKRRPEKETEPSNDEEELSDLEDEDEFILSRDESKLKKMLWEIVNKEWLLDNAYKFTKSNDKPKRKYKKKVKVNAENPIEAIKQSEKLGKNINFDNLDNLFVS